MTTAATEVRRVTAPVTLRDAGAPGDMRISGTAVVFGAMSEDLGFREVIRPGAFRRTLARSGQDVTLLWAHDEAQPLARVSAGNLRLHETATGLEFEADIVPTTQGRDALLLMRAGVVDQMSFGFTMKGGRDAWSQTSTGEDLRTIHEVGELFEISLVAQPAYKATSAEPAVRAALQRIHQAETKRRVENTLKGTTVDRLAEIRRTAAAAAARHKPVANPTAKAAPRVEVRERSPYGDGSEHSWFIDAAAAHSRRDIQAIGRMNRHQAATEKRAIVTSTLGGMVPSVLPPYLQDAVAASVRSSAPLAAALLELPLPPVGMNVAWAKFTTGATVTNQTAENTAATQSADPVIGSTTDALGTIAAFVDFSAQADDRSGGWFDRLIAQDMGEAYAARLEQQVWAGTGTNQQLRGFTVMTGNSSSTVSGQTLALTANQLFNQYQQVATNLGVTPDVIAMAPRRYAALGAATAALGLPIADVIPDGCDLIVSPAAPTTLGAGTEDWILVANRASTPLVKQADPTIEFQQQGPSAGTNLTFRALIYGYAALGVSRRPEGIGLVKGLTPPTFA